jgi:pyridoxal phosphate enzyme (YggS family)
MKPLPRGRRRKARSSAASLRSSEISHKSGKVWRAGIAALYAPGMESAATRLENVREKIARACRIAGREASEVTLVAISKTHPAEAIVPLIEAGQRVFGENRVQEAQGKWPQLRERFADVELHLVGQLQSNKAEDAVALFDAIHSLDRSSLVGALAKAMDKAGKQVPCFVQVNIGAEEQKGGCDIAALPGLLAEARAVDIPLAGLMCVPPARSEPAPFFALLDKLARDNGLAGRSMGMSGDYETAIMLGATHVRVGTALFGERGG